MAQMASENNILGRKFTENFTYLQKKVSCVEEIVNILIEKGVINIQDRPKYLNENKLHKEKIDDVLQEVMTKKKFEEFIFALRKTDQVALIETLTPNKKEFDEFIGLPEKGAVSSSTKTVIDLKTELEQQTHKIVELEAEKKKLQQDIDHLKDVQRGVRETLEKNISRIKMLKKDNNEKKQLEKDVQQLQHDLDNSNEELKKKTEYVDTLEKQYNMYKEVVELNKNILERSKEDRKPIKEDRKEREMDRKEREEDRKQRLMDIEQMKKDREQRDMGLKISQEISTKMDLVLSKFEQHEMKIDQNETSETKQPPTPRPNIAFNLRKNNTDKKNNNSK